jgi:RHS repeat-associated protein
MSGTLNQGVAYTHNNDFKVASLSYGGYTDTLSYDDDGLPTDIGLFTISRNPDNGLPENVFDTNLIAYRTFNGYGEMDSQSISVGSNDLGSWSLTRNDNGRITSKTDSLDGSTSTYTYDTLGRLLTVSKDNVLVEEYRYNANGSRIFEYNSLRGINGREYTYSAEDHLVSAGSTTLAYDADGFLTEKTDTSGITRYAYSSQGELLQVTQSDATVINYVHDPLGRRIAKKVNGAMVEKYLWFGQTTLLAVYDGNDNLLMRFEYGDGRLPLAMTTGASRYYLSYDQVGTLRTVADTAGNIVKQIDYDTFGNILADSNPAFTVPFGFAGGLHDRDTGLVRFGYRDFAPEVGRWTAKDPIFFAGGDTDLFGYVQNDPVNFVDPTGQFLVSGTVLVGYVYGPAIVAAGTAAAYRLGPYLPAILDYAEGFLPGPPSTALGVGGALTKEILENTWDSISDALENNDKPCP